MNTPICDFVQSYISGQPLRLHMPGHKGQSALGCELRDITEIDGADVLYHATGVIRQSEENAATLFGTAKTLYSAEGSSLAIRGMLYLSLLYGKSCGRVPKIAAVRNAHKTFMTAAALLDMEVEWIYPAQPSSLLVCNISADTIERYLQSTVEKPVAVYLTSPDYLGNVQDVSAIAAVCHRYGVLLLVDNAHGAYLHFLPESCHPIALGADLCCDSAHKTLPVLTGGAYLHVAHRAPTLLGEHAEEALSLFASTSPSYLILQSLDRANAYLATEYRRELVEFSVAVDALKGELKRAGFMLCGNEPLKLTIAAKAYGYTGGELAALLSKDGVFCEFYDPDYLVMMLTPQVGLDGLSRLKEALTSIRPRTPILTTAPGIPCTERVMTMREALLSPSVERPVGECVGCTLASPAVTCPPAIPIVTCGERITDEAVACFSYYGIETCRVVER